MPQPKLLTLTVPVRTLADPADLLDAGLALKDYLQGETCEPVEVLEDDVSVAYGPPVAGDVAEVEVKALRTEVTRLREQRDEARRAHDGIKATADTLAQQVTDLSKATRDLAEKADQSRRARAVLRSLLLAGGAWTEEQVRVVLLAVEASR